jgi:hypothetical protein
MLEKEKKVQGVAVYAEFENVGETMQMLITPDCYSNSGNLVPMALHRRVITPVSPKKQWRTTTLRHESVKALLDEGRQISEENVSEFTEQRMRYGLAMFDELIKHGWKIRQKPILTEISRFDADDIAKGNTPNKVLYRINISRKSLGFPAELV